MTSDETTDTSNLWSTTKVPPHEVTVNHTDNIAHQNESLRHFDRKAIFLWYLEVYRDDSFYTCSRIVMSESSPSSLTGKIGDICATLVIIVTERVNVWVRSIIIDFRDIINLGSTWTSSKLSEFSHDNPYQTPSKHCIIKNTTYISKPWDLRLQHCSNIEAVAGYRDC